MGINYQIKIMEEDSNEAYLKEPLLISQPDPRQSTSSINRSQPPSEKDEGKDSNPSRSESVEITVEPVQAKVVANTPVQRESFNRNFDRTNSLMNQLQSRRFSNDQRSGSAQLKLNTRFQTPNQVIDNVKFEYTKCDYFVIVMSHLLEPTLIGFIIGMSLQFSELSTIIYLFITLCLMMPMLLSDNLWRIKFKLILSVILLVLGISFVIMKSLLYTKFPLKSQDWMDFLGVYPNQFEKTFLIDIFLFVFSLLLIFCYYDQQMQVQEREKLQAKKFQTKIKFMHILFGKSERIFYWISAGFFFFAAMLYPTILPALFTCFFLFILFQWSLNLSLDQNMLDYLMRFMEISSTFLLIVQFTIGFPYILGLINPDKYRLLSITGANTLINEDPTNTIIFTNQQEWLTRTTFLVLTFAICYCEVYFVSKRVLKENTVVKQAQPIKPQGDVNSENVVSELEIAKVMAKPVPLSPQVRSVNTYKNAKLIKSKTQNSSKNQKGTIEKLWEDKAIGVIYTLARLFCFVQTYLMHDYQSLVFLTWFLTTLFQSNPRIFVRLTSYIWFPLMIAVYMWYYVTNIFNLINWAKYVDPQNLEDPNYQVKRRYNYGFYQLQVPFFLLMFFYANLFLIAYWTRLRYQQEEKHKKEPKVVRDFQYWNSTLFKKLSYNFLVNIQSILLVFLLIAGIAKLNLYHATLLIVFVWSTFHPKKFQQYSVFILIYCEFFIVAKYIFTLITKTENSNELPPWVVVVGFNTNYNPNNDREYWRYYPQAVNWILVMLMFLYYRRTNLIGRDEKQHQEFQDKISKNLQRDYPRFGRVWQYIKIIFSHFDVLIAFIFLALIFSLSKQSFIDLVSITLLLLLFYVFLGFGVQELSKKWWTIKSWSAIIILSQVIYQFLSTTSWGKDIWSSLTLRQQAWVTWVGFFPFGNLMWFYFMPYVLFFLITMTMSSVFKEKIARYQRDLSIDEKYEDLVHISTDKSLDMINFSEKQKQVREYFLDNQSGVTEISEEQLRDRQISEKFFEIKYRMSFVFWKLQFLWPLFDFCSRYYIIVIYISIFCYALYYQISILSLFFVFVATFQFWSVTSEQARLRHRLKMEFMHQCPPVDTKSKTQAQLENDCKCRQNLFRHGSRRPVKQSKLEARLKNLEEQNFDADLEKDFNIRKHLKKVIKQLQDFTQLSNTNLSKEQRYYITDVQAVFEKQKYEIESKKISVNSRSSYWHLYFFVACISISIMYSTTFLITYYPSPDGKTDDDEYLVPKDNQNTLIFLTFWGGFYRNKMDKTTLGSSTQFFDAYWAFFIFLIILTFERFSIIWMQNRFGCTDQVIQLYKQIQKNYDELQKRKTAQKKQLKQNETTTPGLTQQKTVKSINDSMLQNSLIEQTPQAQEIQVQPESDSKHISEIIVVDEVPEEELALERLKKEKKQLVESILPLLQIKNNLAFNYALRCVTLELIIFLLWVSCAYQANIYSIVLIFVILRHAYSHCFTPDRYSYIKYTVGVLILLQYLTSVLSLSSYNSPIPTPINISIPPTCTINEGKNPVYPNKNNTGYFDIPFYFSLANVTSNNTVNSTDEACNGTLYIYPQVWSFFGVSVTNEEVNGIWILIVAWILYWFFMSKLNIWLHYEPYSIKTDPSTYRKLRRYAVLANIEMDPNLTEDQQQKQILKEINQQRFIYRTFKTLENVFYAYGILLVVTVTIFISIFSQSFLSFGYFIFAMILIYQSRYFLVEPSAAADFEKTLKFLIPYLILEMLLVICCQYPLIMGKSTNFFNTIGIGLIWAYSNKNSEQQSPLSFKLYFGQDNQDMQITSNYFGEMFAKGFLLFLCLVEILLLHSNGFKKFQINTLIGNIKYSAGVATGIAYRQNNINNEKVIQMAQGYGGLQTMLEKVQDLLKKRDNLFNLKNQQLEQQIKQNEEKIDNVDDKPQSQQNLIMPEQIEKALQEKASSQNGKNAILEEDQIQSEFDYQNMFKTRSRAEYVKRIQALSVFVKLYLFLKRNLVQDLLFAYSTEHLFHMIEQYRCGRKSTRTAIEIGIMLRSRRRVLEQLETELEEKSKQDEKKWENIKQEFQSWKLYELNKIKPHPWEIVDIDSFDDYSKLFKYYCVLFWKIVASNTSTICYIFMVILAIQNGGLFYMIYPALVFGYALMLERGPGISFWYFVVIYTQIMLLSQVIIQLSVFESNIVMQQIIAFSQQYNLGLIQIQPIDYSFHTVLHTFYAEILVILCVLIHIQSEQKSGLADSSLQDFETFEQGLFRYLKYVVFKDDFSGMFKTIKSKIMKDDLQKNQGYEQYRSNSAPINLRSNVNISLIQQRMDEAESVYSYEFNDLDIDAEILKIGLDPIDKITRKAFSQVDERELQEVVNELKNVRDAAKTTQKVKSFFSIIWDNSLFDEIFPLIKQQKPGEDLYVWEVTIGVFLIIYTFFFFPAMTNQYEVVNLSQQINATQLQAPMIFTLIVIMAFMLFDRIFYNLQGIVSKDSMIEKLKLEKEDQEEVQQPTFTSKKTIYQSQRNQSVSDSYGVQVTNQTQTNFHLDDNDEIPQVDLIESTSLLKSLEQSEVKVKRAFYKSLLPKYSEKTLTRVIKYYYILGMIILLQWYVFFYCVSYAQTNTSNLYVNRVNQNASLIFFYLLTTVYLWVQAYQIRKGLPELKKGGFMIGKYSPIAKGVFYCWYYIPFMFELRTIIDWTFAKSALDVFQSIKLAQVQAQLYIAHATNQQYAKKVLGAPQTAVDKVVFGGGLLCFVFLLIIGPMLLFSNLNPFPEYNFVTGGGLRLSVYYNDNDGQSFNVPLFTTTQIQSNSNFTQSQYDQYGLGNSSNINSNSFKPTQVQGVQFSMQSDSVWTISEPQRKALEKALTDSQNISATDSAQQVRLVMSADLTRYQLSARTVQIQQSRQLNSKTLDFTQSLIDMINCAAPNSTFNNVTSNQQFPIMYTLTSGDTGEPVLNNPTVNSDFVLIYICSRKDSPTNYWQLKPNFINSTLNHSQSLNEQTGGLAFIFLNQTQLPSLLSGYGASILIFYATVVYIVASSFRSGFVPQSYTLFIENAVYCEDIIMICQCIYIYRLQKSLDNEENLFMVLMDIMRSPETLKSITGTSQKEKVVQPAIEQS